VKTVETGTVNSNSCMTTAMILGLSGPRWLIFLTAPCLHFLLDVDGD
jgi:hypothetical protein